MMKSLLLFLALASTQCLAQFDVGSRIFFSGGGIVVSDDFNYCDHLSSNWTNVETPALNISGPGCTNTSSFGTYNSVSNNNATAYWNANSIPANQFSQSTMETLVFGGSPAWVGVTARQQPGTGLSGYLCIAYNSGSTLATILYTCTNETCTQLGSGASPSPGDVVRIEAVGTTISCKLNGTVIASGTDTTYASGQPGIGGYGIGYGGAARAGHWSGGSISSTLPSPAALLNLCGDTSSTSGCTPTSSTTAYDSSGHGYNGTWSGTASGTTSWYSANTASPPPYVGTFNGSNDIVDTTYPTNTAAPLTMCGWIYHTHTGSNGVDFPFSRMEQFHNSWDGWYMQVSDTTLSFVEVSNGTFSGTTGATVALNTWDFACGTDDNAGNIKVYLNGVLAGTGTYTASPVAYDWMVEIGNGGAFVGGGSNPAGGHPFTGFVSRVSVYNQVLTAAQIAAIYAAH